MNNRNEYIRKVIGTLIKHYRKQNTFYVNDFIYEVDDFYGEITHVMECLKNQQIESPIHPLTSSIRLAKIVDDIKQKIAI